MPDAASPAGELVWTVNGVEVGRARDDERVDWTLARGTHRVVARDASGETAAVPVLVK